MKNIMIRILAIVILCTICNPVFAQFGGGGIYAGGKGTVSGTGTVRIDKQPEIMRLQIDLLFKAATLSDALSGLKDRIEAARIQLDALGADKESIKIGSPKISTDKSDKQQQIEMMITQRMMNRGNRVNKNQKAITMPLTVTVQLIAEWKMTAKTTEELLLFSHPLREKIKEADLAGIKQVRKLSPEEQELLEEAEDSSSGYSHYGSDDESKPGEPIFLFVSRISEEEENKAMAKAYQKARFQASRLAIASNSQIGNLISISSQSGAPEEDRYDSEYYQLLQKIRSAVKPEDNQTEAVGVLPKRLNYQVRVTAGFELKEN